MAIIVSVKSPQQLAQSVLAIPDVWHWDNFSQAVQITNYFHTFGNSFFITFVSVVLTVLTNSMVAYAIARNRRNIVFKSMYYYFFAAMFVPFQIIMLPLVRQMSHIGLANLIGLIVLYLVYGLSLNIFLYIGYLQSIPMELEEAARVDGASRWAIFWRIIFPLMSPMKCYRCDLDRSVGVERLYAAASNAVQSESIHASSRAVCVPVSVQHQLQLGIRFLSAGLAAHDRCVYGLPKMDCEQRDQGSDQIAAYKMVIPPSSRQMNKAILSARADIQLVRAF